MQHSILYPVSCYGVGVHSGKLIQITLRSAKENTGVIFIRTDVKCVDNVINASLLNVSDTSLSTTIKNSNNIMVSTVEHLMAAIWGCGIDNIIVEIDGPEVPIMDGSSKPFVFMIECAQKKLQNAPRKYLKLLKEINFKYQDSEITAIPSKLMTVDLTIEFSNKIIGKQCFSFFDQETFKQDIAPARTFGFIQDLNFLRKKGLAKGASLDNSIGIDQEVILNYDGLRYQDEFVRHKLLDFLGDCYTIGGYFIGAFTGYKTGHNVNNLFLRQLFSKPSYYKWVGVKDL